MSDLTKQQVNYWVDIHSIDRLNKNDPNGVLKFKFFDLININSFNPLYVSAPYLNLSPTIYNVSSYTGNNKISWIEHGISDEEFDVTIPDGNYNINAFLAEFKVILEAESLASGFGWEYELTYNSTTGKLTVTTNNPVRDFTLKIPNAQFNYLQFFGISNHDQKLNTEWDSISGVFISPSVVNYNTYTAVYLRSNLYRNQTYETMANSQGKASNILTAGIPTANGFANISTYAENNNITKIQVNEPFSNVVNFFLTSENENFKIDIQGDWSIVLLFNYDNQAIVEQEVKPLQIVNKKASSRTVRKNII